MTLEIKQGGKGRGGEVKEGEGGEGVKEGQRKGREGKGRVGTCFVPDGGEKGKGEVERNVPVS